MPLEDVIAHHLDALFPGMEIVDYDVFRVTRDADLEVSDDAADLLQAVEDELRRRRFGEIVRVEIGTSCSERLREELIGLLGVREDEVYPVAGLLDMGALWQIVKLPGMPELRNAPYAPVTHPRLLRHEGERPDVLGRDARGRRARAPPLRLVRHLGRALRRTGGGRPERACDQADRV